MSYFTELRTQWRPMLGALIGLGFGFSMTNYTTSIMAPRLIESFGWSKSEFALIGSLGLASVFVFPFIGRLTDLIGVQKTALIGVIVGPLAFLALSMMTGDIRVYIALYLLQGTLCITTTTTVYGRTVVQYIKESRGLALAIVASGPALTGAIGGPLLNNFVEAHGWRAGYLVLATITLIAGATALLLLPRERKAAPSGIQKTRTTKGDYRQIFRSRPFWLMVGAMLLCNLPQVIALTQLNLVLLDNGVPNGGVSVMISTFATGVLCGRFVCGVALDRFTPHIVAAVSMALPAAGLFLLASDIDTMPILMTAVALIGLSFGAEGDVISYLVVRYFGVNVFSSVMGMLTAIISISASLGAIAVSETLRLTGGYTVFLVACGVAVLLGALFLLFLRSSPVHMSVDTQ